MVAQVEVWSRQWTPELQMGDMFLAFLFSLFGRGCRVGPCYPTQLIPGSSSVLTWWGCSSSLPFPVACGCRMVSSVQTHQERGCVGVGRGCSSVFVPSQ